MLYAANVREYMVRSSRSFTVCWVAARLLPCARPARLLMVQFLHARSYATRA